MNKELRIKEDAGTLFVIATPIGNLKDITIRALEVLKSADLIACEDTRVSGKLLAHFDIKKPLVSYFQHSKLSKIEYIIEELRSGKNIALITDAGTPGISDPGQQLVSRIRNKELGEAAKNPNTYSLIPNTNIRIIPIPGASALAGAASVSGMIEKEFYFAGFLPKKKGRQTQFQSFKLFNCPIVIYESALRLERTLSDIQKFMGENTEVFIAREMTKMFEEYWGGSVGEVILTLKDHQIKGEVVLVIKSN